MTTASADQWSRIAWTAAVALSVILVLGQSDAQQPRVQQPVPDGDLFPLFDEQQPAAEPATADVLSPSPLPPDAVPQDAVPQVPPPPQPGPAALDAAQAERDPMVPSPEILQLLQPPRAELPPAAAAAPARAAAVALGLPEFELRAIVLTSASSGTALLASGGRLFSVALGREPVYAKVDFPPRQFWQYGETFARIDEMISDDEVTGPPDELPGPAAKRSVRLDGFSVNGIFFCVEDFSERAVLLRAYPHEMFVLVQ